MSEYITGIQQIGIGVADADEAKYLYRDLFGMDVLVFDDKASAHLMTRYTGNEIHERRALLTMNLNGGGGFEIWQFTDRTPASQKKDFVTGTPGINSVKIKTRCINTAQQYLSRYAGLHISSIKMTPEQEPFFEVTDKYDNRFQVQQGKQWFKNTRNCMGGVMGVVIGVTNMDRSVAFYQQILGNATCIYDVTETSMVDGTEKKQRRVLLRKSVSATGAFTRLLGSTDIELIQLINEQPDHVFKDRYWGDCGYIHICFDVLHMDKLKQSMEANGNFFTVDSAAAFAMQDAAGRFCYVEDPDGTLIELVQTHKVPVLKKLGWYINLTKRTSNKPLPNWMVAMLGLNKVK